MLIIESETVVLNCAAGEALSFLGQMNNTGKLMPDQITNWNGDADKCSYTIKGMADISMSILERNDNSIMVKSLSDKPFSFTITYKISTSGSGSTAQIVFDGDVNPFLKMMVEKPLGNLFNYMIKQLPKQFTAA